MLTYFYLIKYYNIRNMTLVAVNDDAQVPAIPRNFSDDELAQNYTMWHAQPVMCCDVFFAATNFKQFMELKLK